MDQGRHECQPSGEGPVLPGCLSGSPECAQHYKAPAAVLLNLLNGLSLPSCSVLAGQKSCAAHILIETWQLLTPGTISKIMFLILSAL